MKELTIEQKAQKYDEAIEAARCIYNNMKEGGNFGGMEDLEVIFHELRESDDERVRKEIITYLSTVEDKELIPYESWIVWLEKQGEQKPTDTCDSSTINGKEFPASEKRDFGYFSETADKVEPKFKVGDWITNGDYTWKIVDVKPLDYILQSQDGNIVDDTISHVDEQFHSFTVEDVKDGDVLADSLGNICIYQEPSTKLMYHSYCYGNHKRFIDMGGSHEIVGSYPATKEQRDTLEKAMTDAGYTFDFEKKELKKIEQKPAWSKEDEKEVAVLEAYIRSNDWSERHIDRALGIVDELVNKVKSIKTQTTWKPSEGQLECLGYAIEKAEKDWFPLINNRIYLTLKALKEQLEKL